MLGITRTTIPNKRTCDWESKSFCSAKDLQKLSESLSLSSCHHCGMQLKNPLSATEELILAFSCGCSKDMLA
ncbi:hypothetical protein AMECASPLE_014620 [Ameca splendens]|uniref:Uncharacterized protein n=1 Tax=Ameca splendens TaxID=208324 RepID=A0ABV0XES1_9TELE